MDGAPPPITRLPDHLADLTVEQTWARIDAWLAERHPALTARLAGPASEAEIDRLEQALGTVLPDDYKASLRVHAGGRSLPTTDGESSFSETPFAEFNLLPPDVLLASMKRLESYAAFPDHPYARIAPTVRRVYYDPGWIPVVKADEDFAVIYCIDTVPTEPAARGQIVQLITSADPDRLVRWPGFRECLIGGLLERIESEAVDPEALEDAGWIRFVEET